MTDSQIVSSHWGGLLGRSDPWLKHLVKWVDSLSCCYKGFVANYEINILQSSSLPACETCKFSVKNPVIFYYLKVFDIYFHGF